MPARILNISDPYIHFPDFIVLDASVVLELRRYQSQPHPNHDQAVNFFRRVSPLAAQGQVMLLLPLLAFEECLFKICVNEIRTLIPNNARWQDQYKAHPELILTSRQLLLDFYSILKGFPIVIVEPEDIAVLPIDTVRRLADRLPDMILNFQVLPKDATILSVAERLGVDTVVTLDSDWKRADGFTVITTP